MFSFDGAAIVCLESELTLTGDGSRTSGFRDCPKKEAAPQH